MRYSEITKNSGHDIFERLGNKRQYSPGQMVSEHGMPAKKILFLAKGQLRAFFLNPEGEEITLFYLNPGNIFCFESLIGHPSIIVNIDAFSEADVYSMEPELFLSTWDAMGYSTKDLLAHLIKRILLLSDYLCCARFAKSEERLAYFLYFTYYEDMGPILYTHEQLAAMVSMSKVSVDRTLKKLENDKIISCKYRKIEVIDPDKLIQTFNSLGYFIE